MMKKAYKDWPPEENWDEFWQEVNDILKQMQSTSPLLRDEES